MGHSYEFAACVAFHCLRLTVTSIVIGATAFVACSWTRIASANEATARADSISATRDRGTATNAKRKPSLESARTRARALRLGQQSKSQYIA